MPEFKYRKASLSRLSSSEQLDHLMKVTASRDWIILAVIGSLTVAALLWSIFGQLPIRVNGKGILIRSGGIFQIVSLGAGQLMEINVDVDDVVSTGDIVARISQPIQSTRLNQARVEVVEMRHELQRLRDSVERSLQMHQIHSDNERINLMKSIDFEQERLHWLKEKQGAQDILMQQGLITKQTVVNTRQEINSCKERIENDRNRLQQIAISDFQMKDQKEREIRNSEQQLLKQERELQSLEKVYEESTLVISPYTGRILEVTADTGKSAHVGDSLMSLERTEESGVKLEAVVFVPPAEGKKVQPGMNIHISPSTVKPEEYGFMLGRVNRVSEFPATTDGMMRLLHNQNLVQALTVGGAPIQIHAELLPDSRTQSGFTWSSSKGPPIAIHSGTMCSARIMISEESPIHLLIPYVKKNVLGE